MADPSEEARPQFMGRGEMCTCCRRLLRGNRVRMLELNGATGLYSEGNVPSGASKGWFPFGWICAKRILANGGRMGP
jgi:hypothetical protein